MKVQRGIQHPKCFSKIKVCRCFSSPSCDFEHTSLALLFSNLHCIIFWIQRLSTLFGYAAAFMTCMASSQTWLTIFPLRHARQGCTGGTPKIYNTFWCQPKALWKEKKSPHSINNVHGKRSKTETVFWNMNF